MEGSIKQPSKRIFRHHTSKPSTWQPNSRTKRNTTNSSSPPPSLSFSPHAQYSPNSRTFKTEFNDLAGSKAVDGKFAFAWFNAFDADDINNELMVRQFPAYFFYKDGERVKSVQSSNATKESLEKDVEEFGK